MAGANGRKRDGRLWRILLGGGGSGVGGWGGGAVGGSYVGNVARPGQS